MYGVELYAAVRLAVVNEGLSLLQGNASPFRRGLLAGMAESPTEAHCPRLFQVAFIVLELVRGFHSRKHSKGFAVAAQPYDLLHNFLAMLPV